MPQRRTGRARRVSVLTASAAPAALGCALAAMSGSVERFAEGRARAVKVCGVTTADDARRCVELGADLVGLNFHPQSPRFVSEERALALREAVAGRALVVGVFVHATVAEALQVAERVGLDLLQFHGEQALTEQTLDELAPVASRSIVVLRAGETPPAELATAGLWGALIDAPIAAGASGETLFGGTGIRWSYERANGVGGAVARLLLAGGIGPDNAVRALSVPGVWGIDVCSGVEASPGRKDPDKLERLFAAVRGELPSAIPTTGG